MRFLDSLLRQKIQIIEPIETHPFFSVSIIISRKIIQILNNVDFKTLNQENKIHNEGFLFFKAKNRNLLIVNMANIKLLDNNALQYFSILF